MQSLQYPVNQGEPEAEDVVRDLQSGRGTIAWRGISTGTVVGHLHDRPVLVRHSTLLSNGNKKHLSFQILSRFRIH